ncbi:HIR complex subunit [Coemansia sp. RSA 1813]|nr:HIR complex subunit [Coemansia sp. RSA 1646]KAJ1764924.1 HIR complex subunit [Coemansia sp. RSA 1843]KAJ2086396.1 HIR complex subunit [Coemansia sp. RSA 986]KAJ2215671.1 HIR complex subunit [Coemansia sp. RSA 487]KAJ2568415.1 HIR complex subunit [Coemansia sp. RSA 1813]
MRITKPDWLHHDADKKKLTTIFSVDFHPDGTRLATAGIDNKIRIWNTRAITKASAVDEKNSRLLSTLTAHSGAVMCVRFSPDAQYMASGADDMIVLIWERDTTAAEPSTNNIIGNSMETWHPVRRLTGHESDVVDIAWSPDNRFLATSGLDNVICIWDTATFDRVAKLTGHTQFVKGVTFDPAGKYLASQSDDRTMKIWRTSDWGLQATVAKPFADNIFSTYFCRPSWSPDGDCVAAANAVNGKVPVAAVVSRDTWAADLSFVGHHAAIEAVCFNPRVFSVPTKSDQDSDTSRVAASICAAGGQDRGITVWLTSQPMPIVAATDLFAGNLLDLSWYTPSPSDPTATIDEGDKPVVAYLAACSFDGTVAVLEFTEDELGHPVPAEEQEEMLARNGWVRRRGRSEEDEDELELDRGAAKRPRPIAESVAQLQLEEQGAVLCKVPKESRIAQLMDGAGSTMPNTSISSIPNEENTPAPTAMPVPVRTKSGKKRVAPLLVRPLGSSGSGSIAPPTPTLPAPRMASAAAAPVVVGGAPAQPPRANIDAPIWIEAQVLGTRQMVGKAPSSSFITDLTSQLGPQTLVHAQTVSAARVHLSVPRIVAQLKTTVTAPRQASLQPEDHCSPTVAAYNSQQSSQGTIQSSRLVCSSSDKQHPTMWTKHFAHAVIAVAASDQLTAASLSDGSLHWFDTRSGVRLSAPLVSEAHLAHLRCQDQFCLALDSVGQLSVWDTQALEAIIDRVSIAPLLYTAQLSSPSRSKEPSDASADTELDDKIKAPKRHKPMVALTAVDILGTGAPVLCFSDGRVHTYHSKLRTWMRIGDPSEYLGSDYYVRPSPDNSSSRSTSGSVLEFLQERGYYQHQRTNQVNNKQPLVPLVPPNLDPAVKYSMTLDHLEHQLRASDTVGSDDEVIRYADLLARQLVRSADNRQRVSRWLVELLGPPLVKGIRPSKVKSMGNNGQLVWIATMGSSVPKRQLLERILPVLATNRHFQELVDEYSSALKQAIK